MDLSKAATFQRAKSRVEGEDISHIIIFIPLTMANMKEAIDNALEKVPGAVALVDGVLYQRMYIFILYDQVGFIIEGTPLIDPSLAKGPLPSSHMICRLDGSGKVEEFSYVTKDEYGKVKAEAVGAD